jgi:Carboxypeptidase regulatory-like domain
MASSRPPSLHRARWTGRLRGGGEHRFARSVVLVGVALALALSFPGVTGGGTGPGHTNGNSSAQATPPSPLSPGGPLRPGAGSGTGSLGPAVDPIAAGRILSANPYLLAHMPRNATALYDLVRNGTPAPRPALREPVAPPTPEGLTYGFVTGTIVEVLPPYAPIAGANVSVFPFFGSCPPVGCQTEVTSGNGTFQLPAAAGENEVYVDDSYYVTNRTWTNVTAGGYVSVGHVGLVRDGFVEGTVLADDPGHEPIGGVNLTAVTRDGSFQAFPNAATRSDGTFTLAVPPLPSEIDLAPGLNTQYDANLTWVNVSAGHTVDIGTIYLEHFTDIAIEVVNAITGAVVPPGLVSASACSKVSAVCTPGVPELANGSSLDLLAPVGPDSVSVTASGYVVNATSLGVVPKSALDAPPVAMGTVDVVPLGEVALQVNISGLPPPYNVSVPTSLWPVGLVVAEACSLDGYVVPPSGPAPSPECTALCTPPGVPFDLPAAPLREYIAVFPDTAGLCGLRPTWPEPPDMPVWGNWTWVNVTAGRVVNLGSLDLLPGTYVEGEVLPKSSTGWEVSVCSTDEPTICGPAAGSDSSYATADSSTYPPVDCPAVNAPTANYTFCAAAPPGPDEIDVISPSAASNWTWGNVPFFRWAVNPLPLAVMTTPGVAAIWLVPAVATGRVLSATTLLPVPGLGSVSVCPAGNPPPYVVCGGGATNASGYFDVPAPIGWDVVDVGAPGYVGNTSWVYVERNNSTGTILVDPLAFAGGQVVTPGGAGIYSATVRYCPSVDPTACSLLGPGGETSTDGQYLGPLPGLPPPLGTYEIQASAPGYASDWTWVNVTTPGESATAPPIVLAPLGPTGGGRPAGGGRPMAGSSAAGSWVAGRIVDQRYGEPLPDALLFVQPISGAPGYGFSTTHATGGEFNDSLPVGQYTLEVTQAGFYTSTLYLNITGLENTVQLGTVALTPYPTITGRVVIDPGAWRAGVTRADGLGPPAALTVCTSTGADCAPGDTDLGGDFNMTAPSGTYDVLTVTPSGFGPGTYLGGFLTNQTYLNVSNASGVVGRAPLVGLDVFGEITGRVVSSTGGPVRFDQIGFGAITPVDETGSGVNVSAGVSLTGAGNFTVFLPPARTVTVVAGGRGAWVPEGTVLTGTQVGPHGQPGFALGAGGLLEVGTGFSLPHYGWITMQVSDSSSGAAVPYASLSVSEPGSVNGKNITLSSTGLANGVGWLNVTSPPSLPSTQQITLNLSATDYEYQLFSALVTSGQTTLVNPSGGPQGVDLLPWGWVLGTVVDARTGVPIAGVNVLANGPAYLTGKIGITTSGSGAFVTDAPPGPNDTVTYQLDGFAPNVTATAIATGERLLAPTVTLTGDGLVEGRVVSEPGGQPVAGASVGACPATFPACGPQVVTNASGVFVVAAPVGLDGIWVAGAELVPPAAVYLAVASEQWYWVGVISAQLYGLVVGTALGVPGGAAVTDAEATLCGSTGNGPGTGPCTVTVPTDANGTFFLGAPAGLYDLEVGAPGYNITILTLTLVAGKTISVGVVYLLAVGVGTGLIETEGTNAPVASALVSACEAWGADTCVATATTGADGRYAISGPAGPYELGVTATGFQPAFERVTLVSGATVMLPTISLIPTGPGNRYVVSGTVTVASPGSPPLAGAVVSATGGTSTVTRADGSYSFVLPWGSYSLAVSGGGYVTQRVDLTVTGPVSDLNFSLAVFEYRVSGTVRDGLSGLPLAGVEVTQGGVPLGPATAANGTFDFALANGSHSLVATDVAEPLVYSAVPFQVSVTAGPVDRDLELLPPTVLVYGVVADAATGEALSGAAVSLLGPTVDGPMIRVNTTTDAAGRFSISAYPGTYHVEARETGYLDGNASVTVGSTSPPPVSLDLVSRTALVGSSSGGLAWVEVLAAVVVGGAAVGVVLAVRRARRVKEE